MRQVWFTSSRYLMRQVLVRELHDHWVYWPRKQKRHFIPAVYSSLDKVLGFVKPATQVRKTKQRNRRKIGKSIIYEGGGASLNLARTWNYIRRGWIINSESRCWIKLPLSPKMRLGFLLHCRFSSRLGIWIKPWNTFVHLQPVCRFFAWESFLWWMSAS